MLAAYGVPSVPGRAAIGAEEAADAAALLGFPVVLKRRRFGRPDPRPAAASCSTCAMSRRSAPPRICWSAAAGRSGDAGFLVQRQVGRARELCIRVGEDPVFGPTIGFGQGGTAAQICATWRSTCRRSNLTLAHALIARTRVGRHARPAARPAGGE